MQKLWHFLQVHHKYVWGIASQSLVRDKIFCSVRSIGTFHLRLAPMSDTASRFALLHQMVGAHGAHAANAIERLVQDGQDAALCRINAYNFAARHGLDEGQTVDAFVHASHLGLFDLSWNLLCPGCGGVLAASASLKSVDQATYYCALCAAGYEPTLDEMVEVSFTVSPGVRRIAAHDPHTLAMWDFYRQNFWSSGIRIPEGAAFQELLDAVILDADEIPPRGKCILNVQLPPKFLIVFDPITHSATFIEVQGEPCRTRQDVTVVFNDVSAPTGSLQLRPGPLRLTLENQTDHRVLPGIFIANDQLHDLLGQRQRFLTARDLLTRQTFRDLYRADTLDINQRMKITSLTILFTDLKGSTELYERVGDLAAYDLVRAHFRVLNEVVAAESGSVVKTIGDAVMATFPTAERGLQAALHMREAMGRLNAPVDREDLLLKIGLHEGPCLAVTLNERLDYFGQTVNIAARVQGLAESHTILTTEPVVSNPNVARFMALQGLQANPRQAQLRGIKEALTVFEIP